jgi:hypothetical protein
VVRAVNLFDLYLKYVNQLAVAAEVDLAACRAATP